MNRQVNRGCGLVAALFLAAAATAGEVTEAMLDNGMKVIVKEDHRAPVVVSQVWYKVGASYESDGITGISHMLEHMMFKGTEKVGPNVFSKIIAENGGRENAFTGQDYTAYFQRLEKSRLPIALELEADRMRNLTLPEAEFLKERDVVTEERRMRTEDKPTSLTYEQFMATAFQTSPYHHPIIGWMDDIRNYSIEDLQRWYRMWYAPNNATLVVAGDVDATEVIALAKQHFGPLEPSELAPPKPRSEVKQLGPRSVTVRVPAEVPYLLMGFPVPTVTTAEVAWEPYALEVLAYVLDGGDSARINKHLVRGSQIAASAGVGYDPYDRLQTLFLLEGVPAEGQTVEKVKVALLEQLAQMKKRPVTEQELARVKAQVVAGKVFEQDSVFYQAMQIGTLETIGLEWREMERYADNIRKVSADQVMAVAQKYLDPDRLTTAVLEPQQIASVETGEKHHAY